MNLGAVQLRLGLEEVPGVGPQSGVVAGNHYRTGRSGKPAHPGAHRKARRGILALMRVGGGNNGRIDARSRHGAAQGAYLFICCHNVCIFSFFIQANPLSWEGRGCFALSGHKVSNIRTHPAASPGKTAEFLSAGKKGGGEASFTCGPGEPHPQPLVFSGNVFIFALCKIKTKNQL